MQRPAQQVMNKPNTIFYLTELLQSALKKKNAVYDSIWATWHQRGHPQRLFTFTTCIMFLHSARWHSKICEEYQKTNEYFQGLRYEPPQFKRENFFQTSQYFFLNIVHGTQIKIVILPTVYLTEKSRNGNSVSSDFLLSSFTKNHGEIQAAQSSGYCIVRSSELRDFTLPLICLSASGLPHSGMLIPGFIRSYLIDQFCSLALFVIAKASIHQGT